MLIQKSPLYIYSNPLPISNPREGSDARGKLLAKATEIAVGKNYGVIPVHYQMNTWAAKSTCSYTPRTDERTIATYLNCK